MIARRRRALLAAVVLILATTGTLVLLLGGDDEGRLAPFADAPPGEDPFPYDPGRQEDFERRAAAGLAHPLYVHSPGGVEATAHRVVRYRPLVEATAADVGVDPDTLEALIFLESAGHPDAQASADLAGAVGLTQILAQTATGLLGMRVDLERSRQLTRGIARGRRVEERRRERRIVDERFDPPKAIAATGRYLRLALDTFGREDLAFVSYHMGIGNLEDALAAYGERDIPYAQLFFDSSPLTHPEAWSKLASLGDDSATYLWRVYAAREILRLFRTDVERLRELAGAHLAKNSAEEVLHPLGVTEVFADPSAIEAATAAGGLAVLDAERLGAAGLEIDPRVGELADRLGHPASRYAALRPAALEALISIGNAVRQIGGSEPLVVSSAVRDARYQELLARRNHEATRAYSLHTSGYAFDIRRRYRSREQALAFQFVLDRLSALNLIAWVREPGAIHITVAR